MANAQELRATDITDEINLMIEAENFVFDDVDDVVTEHLIPEGYRVVALSDGTLDVEGPDARKAQKLKNKIREVCKGSSQPKSARKARVNEATDSGVPGRFQSSCQKGESPADYDLSVAQAFRDAEALDEKDQVDKALRKNLIRQLCSPAHQDQASKELSLRELVSLGRAPGQAETCKEIIKEMNRVISQTDNPGDQRKFPKKKPNHSKGYIR